MERTECETNETRVAIAGAFSERGLAKSAIHSAIEQVTREEETRNLAPEAYRMSLLSEEDMTERYRHGKETMDASDLVDYVMETREKRTDGADFSEPAEDEEETAELLPVPAAEERGLKKKISELPALAKEHLGNAVPTWFDSSAADTSANRRTFPLSAFAAIAVIAVSLMLIVASSVLVTRAQNSVSKLREEVDAVSGEIAEMKSDFEVRNDLIMIRDIAVNEYGMVSEDYLRMKYLSGGKEDNIEVFEDKGAEGVGLAALLSAIGIR